MFYFPFAVLCLCNHCGQKIIHLNPSNQTIEHFHENDPVMKQNLYFLPRNLIIKFHKVYVLTKGSICQPALGAEQFPNQSCNCFIPNA